MRCFVAVELDRALREAIATRLVARLPRDPGVRWCTQQQLHVTLKFLGEAPDELLPQLCQVVAAAAADIEPFHLTVGGLGAFPSPRSPRVLWIAVDDPAAGCARWLAAADPRLAELGFEPETRPFHPHVTLGRSRSPRGSRIMRDVLRDPTAAVGAGELPSGRVRVEQVVLFESRLERGGAQYRPLYSASLGG
jgi:2'-5' RNA ligase